MQKVNNMTEGNPGRLILRFSLPVMVGNLLQMGYSFADSAIVGRMIGVEAFAAVGASNHLQWLVFCVILGLSQGFGTLISQRFGAEDLPSMRRAIAMSYLLAAVLGTFITLGSVWGAEGLLVMLGTPGEILGDAVRYIRVIFGGMGVVFFFNVFCNIFYALGNSRIPQVALIISCFINILLDIVLIAWTPWGVAAAALATVISQVFACLYCLFHLRGVEEARIARSDWRIHGATLRGLLRIGLPLSVRDMAAAVVSLAIQAAINAQGVLFVAGVAAAKNMHNLLFLVCEAMNRAVATYVGQNFGAKKYARIYEGVRVARRMMLGSAVAITAAMLFLGRWVMQAFIAGDAATVAATLDVAVNQLRVSLVLLPAFYLMMLYRGAEQGIGDAKAPLVAGLLEAGARLFAIYALTRFLGVWGIFIAEAIGWPLMAAYLLLAFHRRMRRYEDPSRG